MFTLEVEFLLSGYHAKPWGRHPAQSGYEWPPSPMRLIRSVVAGSYIVDMSDKDREELVRALKTPVGFFSTKTTQAKTKHYSLRYLSPSTFRNDPIDDNFIVVEKAAFVFEGNPDFKKLNRALSMIKYLGRSESSVNLEAKKGENFSFEPQEKWEPTDVEGLLLFPVGTPTQILESSKLKVSDCFHNGALPHTKWGSYRRVPTGNSKNTNKFFAFEISSSKKITETQRTSLMLTVRRWCAPKGKRNKVMVHSPEKNLIVIEMLEDLDFEILKRVYALEKLNSNRTHNRAWFPSTKFEMVQWEPVEFKKFEIVSEYRGNKAKIEKIVGQLLINDNLQEITRDNTTFVSGSFELGAPQILMTIGLNPNQGKVKGI